jgi:hypothetical protein
LLSIADCLLRMLLHFDKQFVRPALEGREHSFCVWRSIWHKEKRPAVRQTFKMLLITCFSFRTRN